MDSFISKYITDKNQKTLASTMILSYMFLILLDCIALSSLSSRVYGIIINCLFILSNVLLFKQEKLINLVKDNLVLTAFYLFGLFIIIVKSLFVGVLFHMYFYYNYILVINKELSINFEALPIIGRTIKNYNDQNQKSYNKKNDISDIENLSKA